MHMTIIATDLDKFTEQNRTEQNRIEIYYD